jgi:type II secretory pathway pseudopilin PulG
MAQVLLPMANSAGEWSEGSFAGTGVEGWTTHEQQELEHHLLLQLQAEQQQLQQYQMQQQQQQPAFGDAAATLSFDPSAGAAGVEPGAYYAQEGAFLQQQQQEPTYAEYAGFADSSSPDATPLWTNPEEAAQPLPFVSQTAVEAGAAQSLGPLPGTPGVPLPGAHTAIGDDSLWGGDRSASVSATRIARRPRRQIDNAFRSAALGMGGELDQEALADPGLVPAPSLASSPAQSRAKRTFGDIEEGSSGEDSADDFLPRKVRRKFAAFSLHGRPDDDEGTASGDAGLRGRDLLRGLRVVDRVRGEGSSDVDSGVVVRDAEGRVVPPDGEFVSADGDILFSDDFVCDAQALVPFQTRESILRGLKARTNGKLDARVLKALLRRLKREHELAQIANKPENKNTALVPVGSHFAGNDDGIDDGSGRRSYRGGALVIEELTEEEEEEEEHVRDLTATMDTTL